MKKKETKEKKNPNKNWAMHAYRDGSFQPPIQLVDVCKHVFKAHGDLEDEGLALLLKVCLFSAAAVACRCCCCCCVLLQDGAEEAASVGAAPRAVMGMCGGIAVMRHFPPRIFFFGGCFPFFFFPIRLLS